MTHFCPNYCSSHVFVTLPLCVLARHCGLKARMHPCFQLQRPLLAAAGEERAFGSVICTTPLLCVAQDFTTGMKNASKMKQHCLFSSLFSLTGDWSPMVYKPKEDLNLLLLRLIKTKSKVVAGPSSKPCLSVVHLQWGGPQSYLKLRSQIITEQSSDSKADACSSRSYITHF